MGISEIMLLAVTVIGAILLAFSIFLFVKRRGAVGGPMLLAGVLAFGVGSFFLFASQNDNPVEPGSASSETKEDNNEKVNDEEEDAGEKETTSEGEAASENNEEASNEEESRVNPPSTESGDEEALNYEGAVVYEIGQVLGQLAYAAEGVIQVYDYNTYTDWEYAANELALLDESIATAEEVIYAPDGYSDFQVAYSQFLSEMQYFSDELYYAAEDYYYEEDMVTLEEYLNLEDMPSCVTDSFQKMEDEADKVFQHEDFSNNIEDVLYDEGVMY